jgi:hypothetical protein
VAAGIHSTAATGDQAHLARLIGGDGGVGRNEFIGAKLYGASAVPCQPFMSRYVLARIFPVFLWPSRPVKLFWETRFAGRGLEKSGKLEKTRNQKLREAFAAGFGPLGIIHQERRKLCNRQCL